MSELVFYTNPMSRGRIVRWMLEEIQADYWTEVIEYGAGMKADNYTRINPMGKVPAIRHDGKVVTETPAIVAYLADAFPAAGLAPAPAERHAYYRWLFFAAGPLEAAVTNKSLGFEIPNDPQIQGRTGYGNYELTVATLVQAVAATPYIAGDKFSAADIYIGSQINWGTQFGTLPEHRAFSDYLARILDREAFHRANEKDDALAAKMNGGN